MSHRYGQYCPLSLAAELLCERWTLVVVSRLLGGRTRFSDIQRGVPRMSPSLLSKRLRELQAAGVVRRRKAGASVWYEATAAGHDLAEIILGLAAWGQAWARDMELDDLDPGFFVWSLHFRLDTRAMPPGRTVIELAFRGVPAGNDRFWLVHEAGEVEMCLQDPELDVDLVVSADLRLFVETWRGLRDLREEIRRGRIRLDGDESLRNAFPEWLLLHQVAGEPRRRPGRERRLAEAADRMRRTTGTRALL